MIEANALGDLHRCGRDAPCLLGSIKGNIGHTEGAAGIASLIKTSLALSRKILPPTVAAAGANPALRLEQQGLTLATATTDLGEGPALAGVSSFGIGGSNVHVLLTTPPAAALREVRDDEVGVITVSAHSPDALHRNATALAQCPRRVQRRRRRRPVLHQQQGQVARSNTGSRPREHATS